MKNLFLIVIALHATLSCVLKPLPKKLRPLPPINKGTSQICFVDLKIEAQVLGISEEDYKRLICWRDMVKD